MQAAPGSADTLDLRAFALRDCGAEVVTTTVVGDALESLARQRPSIVVSDVKMKGNGHTIAAKARELEYRRSPSRASPRFPRPWDRA